MAESECFGYTNMKIINRWNKSLLNFFYVDGEGPVPLEELQNQKYREVMSIRLYYDWST